MKRKIVLFGISLFAAGGLAWGQAAGTGKIKFDTLVYDFGKTSQVQKVEGVFNFTNVGTGVLKLQKPTTSCGCTLANLEKDTLQPGESGQVKFTLNVGPTKSVLQKYITMQTDDPQMAQVNLTVKCEYVPMFEVTPTMVYLQNLRLNTVTNMSVSVKRTDGKPLEVSKVVTVDPWLQASFEPDSSGTAGVVKIQVSPQGGTRSFYENVRIMGKNTNEMLATVYVSGRAVGDIVCMPETLFWSLSGPLATNFTASVTNLNMTNLITRRMLINSTVPNRPVQLTNPSSTIPELSLVLNPRANNTSYELVARLTGVPSTNRGAIMFETDLPSQSKVQVPVVVSVRR